MINKIQVGSKTYSVGGGQAKLVATGTLFEPLSNDYRISYSLNNFLEPNKFYYIRRYDAEYGSRFECLITTFMNENRILSFEDVTIKAGNSDTDEIVNCALNYDIYTDYNPEPNIDYAVITIKNDEELPLYKSVDDILEVYELPFTLGGNE